MPSVERNCPRCYGHLTIDINEIVREDPIQGGPDVRVGPRRWRSPFRWLWAPDVRLSSDFVAAKEWASQYSPVEDDPNADFIVDYAEKRFDYLIDQIGELDKKADELTKLIVAVLGAVVLLLSKVLPEPISSREAGVVGTAGFIFLGLALLIAALCRVPARIETPAEPRDVIAASERNRPSLPQLKGGIAASYHVGVVAAEIVNKWKSNRIRAANILFLIGFAFMTAFVWMDLQAAHH